MRASRSSSTPSGIGGSSLIGLQIAVIAPARTGPVSMMFDGSADRGGAVVWRRGVPRAGLRVMSHYCVLSTIAVSHRSNLHRQHSIPVVYTWIYTDLHPVSTTVKLEPHDCTAIPPILRILHLSSVGRYVERKMSVEGSSVGEKSSRA